jgi:hypothetical protein
VSIVANVANPQGLNSFDFSNMVPANNVSKVNNPKTWSTKELLLIPKAIRALSKPKPI